MPRDRVKEILTLMLSSQMDIRSGCHELTALHGPAINKHEFIPMEFVGYDSELGHIPLPAYYHLWNQEALIKVLQEADEMYKEQVLTAAKELLAALSAS